jgi:hypothetical protein
MRQTRIVRQPIRYPPPRPPGPRPPGGRVLLLVIEATNQMAGARPRGSGLSAAGNR